jgi:hypothetical protein
VVIRLAELDPREVAEEVCGWTIAHAIALFGPDILSTPPSMLQIRHAVACLTHYAQTGDELDARPADYIQTVVEHLYTATHPDVYSSVEGDWSRASEPHQAIDVVIRAAMARDILSGPRGRVPVQCLAALGGVSVGTLRGYGSRGAADPQIAIEDGDVRCSEARRWLAARGVPGFRPSKERAS